MSTPLGHLVIIGVGLIGGSAARALKRAGAVAHITGVGRSTANLEKAKALGVVDAFSTDTAMAVRDADTVLISVPMGAYEAVFSAMAGNVPAAAVITDAGSTKQCAVEAAQHQLGPVNRFVPAHPIAGTECSGVEASFAELFDDRLCILTPLEETDADALDIAKAMWQAAGARIECMSPADHDDFLAAVSHLPHMGAYALVNAVRKLGNETHDPFKFAAGGFRDFTRIASSSPAMWRDIALANREALVHKMDVLQAELNEIRTALVDGDSDKLLQAFSKAKQARDNWLAMHGSNL